VTTGVIQIGRLGLRGGDHGEPGMEESAGGGLREGSGVAEGEDSAAESGVPLMPGEAGGAEGEAELRPCARQEGHGNPSRVRNTKKRARRLDMAESLHPMQDWARLQMRSGSIIQLESTKQYDSMRAGPNPRLLATNRLYLGSGDFHKRDG
jgi:hypothetical protein